MKKALTDSRLSLQAEEFVWAEEGLTDAHGLLLDTLTDWLRQLAPRKVLDLGCGNAALTNELSKARFEMSGLDSSESGIAIGRTNYPALELIHANLNERLPESLHGRYDAVVTVEVVEHLFAPRLLFQRAREAIGKTGTLILTTPYHGFLKNLALAVTNRFDQHWHPLRDYGHIKFFSAKTIKQLFAEQGFRVTRFARVGRCPPLAKFDGH